MKPSPTFYQAREAFDKTLEQKLSLSDAANLEKEIHEHTIRGLWNVDLPNFLRGVWTWEWVNKHPIHYGPFVINVQLLPDLWDKEEYEKAVEAANWESREEIDKTAEEKFTQLYERRGEFFKEIREELDLYLAQRMAGFLEEQALTPPPDLTDYIKFNEAYHGRGAERK